MLVTDDANAKQTTSEEGCSDKICPYKIKKSQFQSVAGPWTQIQQQINGYRYKAKLL